jgi:hypothetical protein
MQEQLDIMGRPDYDYNRHMKPWLEELERSGVADNCVKDGKALPGNRYPPADHLIEGVKPE